MSDAGWIWVTAASQDETVDGAPVTRAAFFPASDARIVRTWDTLGMRGTDSNDVELDGVFVPERRTFRIGIDHTPGPRYDGPLYRAAAMVLVASYVPPVALGIAGEALAELVALAQAKTPFASTTSLRERAVAQSRLGRAEGALRSARTYLHDRIGQGWDRAVAGGQLSLEEKAEVLLAAVQAIEASARAVEAAFSTAGTTAIRRDCRLEQHLRDISVLKQQGFVSESRFETPRFCSASPRTWASSRCERGRRGVRGRRLRAPPSRPPLQEMHRRGVGGQLNLAGRRAREGAELPDVVARVAAVADPGAGALRCLSA